MRVISKTLNNKMNNKYTMSNNLPVYTVYTYRVDVQGYEVIEVDMYI